MKGEAECELARVRGAADTERGRTGRRTVLRAADGVRIEAAYTPYAGPAYGAGTAVPVIVVAHGFTGALERPALRRAADTFAQHAAVVTFSFRGHGGSGGRSTVGDREVLDLAAAVRWARTLGHEGRQGRDGGASQASQASPAAWPRRTVATVGFSMGGSVTVRHAALYAGESGAHTDAVVAVSAPARWYYRGTAPMRRLHWVIEQPMGRLVSRWGLRTRIHTSGWDPVPLSPTAAAPLIAPTPLLVVHGDRDAYFPVDHPLSLAGAADPACTDLWLERGFGHAENAAPAGLLHRIAQWCTSAVA